MNKELLASQLHGSEYPLTIADALKDAAKAAGLVIVYGASDDLMEFDGAIYDEIGAYDGTTALFADGTLVTDNDKCEAECKYYTAAMQQATKHGQTIQALWCKEEPYSWTFNTTIPHATFDVIEDGEPFCRGIVFALADITG